MTAKRDIICISTHYWNDAWFRKQQFMSRLHKSGYRVLYVQPTISMMRRHDVHDACKNKVFLPLLTQEEEDLYLLYPPKMLPRPTEPMSSKISYWWNCQTIEWARRKLGMVSPILWLYRPEYYASCGSINHSSLVVDLVDDLGAYQAKSRRKANVEKNIRGLIKNSDLFITTSSVLMKKYGPIAAGSKVLIPNGYDSYLFGKEISSLPADIEFIKGPIIGFIGTLFGFLDYDLLYHCVANHPDKSFVFVGPIERSGEAGVNKLKSLSNTHFLGRKEKSQIPAYIYAFDLCINPFKIDDVSKSVSPLKVYEYLALGKPVLSVSMEGLSKDPAGKFVHFVTNKVDFSGAICDLLADENELLVEKRLNGIKDLSWDSLFERLVVEVNKL